MIFRRVFGPVRPAQALTGLMSLVVVAAAVAFASRHPAPGHRPSPVRVLPSAPRAATAWATTSKIEIPKVVATPRPSDFDRELQMSFGQRIKRWSPLIAEASQRFHVPENWIRIVMQVESGGRTMSDEVHPITSSAGAMGLMQLMPSTYSDMRADHQLGPDPYEPRDNVMAGAAYLSWLRGKYGYPTMFAAYNDGPGNLEARLMDAGLLPAETRSYLSRVTAAIEGRPSGASGGQVKFTRPNGLPVMIDPGAVVSIRAALPGEYAPGVQSVIATGRLRQGVCESLASARATLRAHGAAV
jgi:soluble lytic murein transglycosylase-like protein